MRFEAQELSSYSVPVSEGSLQEGEVYFSLQFLDRDMLVPIVVPLIFLGKNLDGRDSRLLYFQDFESYLSGVRYSSAKKNRGHFHVRGPKDLNHIFEYEHALDGLLKCALRRRKARNAAR